MDLAQLKIQLQDVQTEMTAEKQLGVNRDQVKIKQLEEREKDLLEQIMIEEQSKKHEERIQAQEETIAAIKLPYDFNALFDNQSANDIIIEVVQQFQRQAYQEHNAEIGLLESSYKDKLRAADDREAQVQRQLDELQKQYQAQADELTASKRNELEALAQATEANKGRDLLAQENESLKAENAELKTQNADLEKQLEAAKQPQKQTEIQGTDRLNALISTAEKAKKASDAFFLRHPDLAPPELKQPEPPAETGNPFRGEGEGAPHANAQNSGVPVAETTPDVKQFQTTHDTVPSTPTVDQSAGQADRPAVSREEFTALVRRVEGLESKANLMGAA